ncbi:unnamed protein product [Psylliodes chrysocephalus]|uniref:Uncharacterized protein n=1 Tax=Psylliodes chrysocephalus TaxID=3402493 RepID=A0A9P0D4F2_9CUCU|nr:unnamed protein product [Psylliodes chrysocephala]
MDLNTSPNVYLLKAGKWKAPQLLYQPQCEVKRNFVKHMMYLNAMSGCKTKFLKTLSKYRDLEVRWKILGSVSPANGNGCCWRKIFASPQYVTSAYKFSSNITSIPFIDAAANQHNLRVYVQVQQWLSNSLDPKLWDWKSTKNGLIPLTNLKPPAPDKLMQQIS